jgi:hypothetical protein
MTDLIEQLHSDGVTLREMIQYLRERPNGEAFRIFGDRGAWGVEAGNGYLVCVPGPDHLDARWFLQKLRKALNSTFKGPDGREFTATPDVMLIAQEPQS